MLQKIAIKIGELCSFTIVICKLFHNTVLQQVNFGTALTWTLVSFLTLKKVHLNLKSNYI